MSTADRRSQIVLATVRLVGQYGVHGTTISRIAAEVGLSEMAAYRHFENRTEILREAHLYLVHRTVAWLRSSSLPLVPYRLREVGEAHLQMLTEDVEMFNAPMMQFVTMPPVDVALHEYTRESCTQILATVSDIVEQGKAQGSLRQDTDPRVFAEKWVSWAQGEDIQYLLSLRGGTFFREPHLRTLDLMIHEVALPGAYEAPESNRD